MTGKYAPYLSALLWWTAVPPGCLFNDLWCARVYSVQLAINHHTGDTAQCPSASEFVVVNLPCACCNVSQVIHLSHFQ